MGTSTEQPEQYLQQWTEYFQSGVNLSSDREINVCKSHYVTMHHAKCARTCKFCNSASAPQWMLGKVILKESGSASNNMELDPLNWICENCFKMPSSIPDLVVNDEVCLGS